MNEFNDCPCCEECEDREYCEERKEKEAIRRSIEREETLAYMYNENFIDTYNGGYDDAVRELFNRNSQIDNNFITRIWYVIQNLNAVIAKLYDTNALACQRVNIAIIMLKNLASEYAESHVKNLMEKFETGESPADLLLDMLEREDENCDCNLEDDGCEDEDDGCDLEDECFCPKCCPFE